MLKGNITTTYIQYKHKSTGTSVSIHESLLKDQASFQGYFVFFFYLGFISQPFTNRRNAGEEGEHFFNSSLPLPPASQTLRYLLGDYCKDFTSAHRQEVDSNWKPLVSERKSLTTKLRVLVLIEYTTKFLTSSFQKIIFST